jgi:hypothetical protein
MYTRDGVIERYTRDKLWDSVSGTRGLRLEFRIIGSAGGLRDFVVGGADYTPRGSGGRLSKVGRLGDLESEGEGAKAGLLTAGAAGGLDAQRGYTGIAVLICWH